MTKTSIIEAHGVQHMPEVTQIFREYEAFLDAPICFKDFEKELADLPGVYAPPTGSLLLGMAGDHVAGCVALCAIDPDLCEMKRLFVRPQFRGLGLGRALSRRIMQDARDRQYKRMGLDTLDFLTAAIHLYKTFGFRVAEPYYTTPREGVMYMEVDLAPANLRGGKS